MIRYAFYPGCSLEHSASAYDRSVKAVCQVLDVDLVEIDDWNCCGATEYWTQDGLTAQAVIARNLARVDPSLDKITAPCAACYLNLRKVDHLMAESSVVCDRVNSALAAGGLSYTPGKLELCHLVNVLHDVVGKEKVRANVKRPLAGLRVAPYYGCQVVRPFDGDDPEYPVKMDRLLAWLGAEVVDYPVKSHCCGGHMTQISEEEAFELIRRLLSSAAEYRADVIACMCPMCQLNLDGYQERVNNHFNTEFKIPPLFFTQLVGLAFGLDLEQLGIGKEIVSAAPMLEEKLATGTSTGGPDER